MTVPASVARLAARAVVPPIGVAGFGTVGGWEAPPVPVINTPSSRSEPVRTGVDHGAGGAEVGVGGAVAVAAGSDPPRDAAEMGEPTTDAAETVRRGEAPVAARAAAGRVAPVAPTTVINTRPSRWGPVQTGVDHEVGGGAVVGGADAGEPRPAAAVAAEVAAAPTRRDGALAAPTTVINTRPSRRGRVQTGVDHVVASGAAPVDGPAAAAHTAPPVVIGQISVQVAAPAAPADPFAGLRGVAGGLTAQRGGGW